MHAAVHPPLRATLPPLRERRFTPSSQHRLLQDELIGVALYRHVVGATEDVALLHTLEAEFDNLIQAAGSLQSHGVYCLQFPPLMKSGHFLVKRCAERYHLQVAAFGEDERRFLAVYLHPRDAMAPVLRLQDFSYATSYYNCPPPPAAAYEPQRKQQRRTEDEDYELEAERLELTQSYSCWMLHPTMARDGAEAKPMRVGYECEIADCHQHLVEVRPTRQTADTEQSSQRLQRCLTELSTATDEESARLLVPVAVRALPLGCVCVFRSAEGANAFIERYRVPAEPSGGVREDVRGGFVDVQITAQPDEAAAQTGERTGALIAAEARQLAMLQRRRGVIAHGERVGAPRALHAALRGLGRAPVRD